MFAENVIVGVNLGKNKESPDPVNDYVIGVQKFADVANYLVINVSSPNTPGLRDMQGRQQLRELVKEVREIGNYSHGNWSKFCYFMSLSLVC